MTNPVENPIESPQWSRTTRILVFLLLLAGIVWLVFAAMPLVESVVIAALLAYLLDPAAGWLTRRFRMTRRMAVIIVYAILLVFVLSIPAALGTLALGHLSKWGTDLRAAVVELQRWLSRPLVIFGFDISPRTLLQNLGQATGSALATIPRGSLGILANLTTNLLWGMVILVSLYYFLKDGPQIKPWICTLAPQTYRGEIGRLLDEIDDVWRIFLRIQILIFVILALLMLAGSFIVLWLYQAGLLPLSPIGLGLMLLLVYALVQQVDNLWLRPQLLGHQLRLHPGLVIVGLIGGLALGGVVMALVVVPGMATIKVVGRYTYRKLLGMPPWPEVEQAANKPTDKELPALEPSKVPVRK